MKQLLAIFFLLATYVSVAQNNAAFTRFANQIDTASTRGEKMRYARLWLDAAREQKNYEQQIAALREVMFNDDRSLLVRYSDTLVNAALNTKNGALIGQSYLTKGISHYYLNQHADALDAYMKAEEYLSASGSEYDKYKLKFGIANTKYYLGFYQDAVSLFEQCLAHYEKTDARAYLSTLYSLGLCYNRLGDYERCADYNAKGLEQERLLANGKMHWYFVYSNGINLFYLKKYDASTKALEAALPHLQRKGDVANVAASWFYLAKSNLETGHEAVALHYFEKVDSSFCKTRYMRPDLRQAYEILINHYRVKGEYRKELQYIRRLKSIDSILGRDYKYLSSKIAKEYDARALNTAYRQAKENIARRNVLDSVGALLLIYALALLFIKYSRLRRYHRNYKKMMADPPVPTALPKAIGTPDAPVENADASKTEKGLNPEIVAYALRQMEKFERDALFRDSAVGLQQLADILGTNATYARVIVQQNRHKGIVDYLRDLRLDYIVEKLKTEGKFRNYTDEALAAECGFGSTQNFTRAFKMKFAIPPRFFIEQLRRDCDDEAE